MYTPKISEKFIPVLYRIAKEEKKPMTRLVNEIIRQELERRSPYECKGNAEHGAQQI